MDIAINILEVMNILLSPQMLNNLMQMMMVCYGIDISYVVTIHYHNHNHEKQWLGSMTYIY